MFAFSSIPIFNFLIHIRVFEKLILESVSISLKWTIEAVL
ncbi:hypothetical protein LEP1GSC062_0021 [Leptospira alexanderi serovar Manhao 3 str. L 60]|uniref:Uncharacterized protein n=1 Tax=Leptospira alexanderi serovar Manhao 3 str. L 60 TaxID=1049759 RepID=V6ID31_9LEPT|nr:hypothetical protein LEP1GSC062_0021 [Leptospira alexanderi serovar Manhao 3 str. L 60]